MRQVGFFLLRLLIEFPIHDGQVNRANPHTDLAGNTLIKLKVNSSAIPFRGNELLVRFVDAFVDVFTADGVWNTSVARVVHDALDVS